MTETRNIKTGQLIAGVIILGIGVLLVLEQATGFYVDGLYRLWPLIVLAIGAGRLLTGTSSKQRGSGLFFIALGTWFLINTFEIFGLEWGDSWPVLLLLLGASRFALPPDDGGRSPGLLLMFIGAWGFVNVHQLWGLDWGNSWSLAIIGVGLFIVWRALFEGRSSTKGEPS